MAERTSSVARAVARAVAVVKIENPLAVRVAIVVTVVTAMMELPSEVCWPEKVVVALVAVAAVGIDRQTPRGDARCRSKDDKGEASAPHKDGGGKQHTRTAAV